MDSKVRLCRSLPPMVDGKIHGYLWLIIDEVIWYKNNPGNTIVLASWWGEQDNAKFRPIDVKTNTVRSSQDTAEIYSIRTNSNLFKEYIKNCETIELVVINEEVNEIVGTSEINGLLDIFEQKPFFKYFPILDINKSKIGEVHIGIKFNLNASKAATMRLKAHKLQEKQSKNKVLLSPRNADSHDKELDIGDTFLSEKFTNINKNRSDTPVKQDIYRSILKTKRAKFQEPLYNCNSAVTDTLVAQVVARAQKLRGAILKETYDEDPLALSDTDSSKKMSASDEHKALNTLRSTSPTPSLIDLASEAIASSQSNNAPINDNKTSKTSLSTSNSMIESLTKCLSRDKQNEMSPLDHVDSIRIFIELFVLSPAGYRRVKSSYVSRNDNMLLSVTYFVQYNTNFKPVMQTNHKLPRDDKSIRISSKHKSGQVIHFNNERIYNLPKFNVHQDVPLCFKILFRHLNQRSPTELGSGMMYISDIVKTENLSLSQRLAVINKGIKIGELKITTELGCDSIHFGKQYIEAVMSGKENIPVLNVKSLLNTDIDKCKTATGTKSKTNNSVSSQSSSTKRIDCLHMDNTSNMITRKDASEHNDQNIDDRKVDVADPNSKNHNNILLHGLIYIAEGKDLLELNTFLICRAFWLQDKGTSQLCSNTRNPYYHFCQLVPLIYGNALLERIKDNYIIVEVYYKNSIGMNNLLGIAKLPVHQLYVAYRDPIVLPHLLSSKYPIISVDEWISINNPVTSQSCGQLHALVALGTAEQIALLEMSRGLKCQTVMVPQAIHDYSYNYNDQRKQTDNTSEIMRTVDLGLQTNNEISQYKDNHMHHMDAVNRNNSNVINFKTQESQTDISTFKEPKLMSNNIPQDDVLNSDRLVLHTLVDRLAHALNVTKTKNQAAQTEQETNRKKRTDIEEESCINSLRCNSMSDDSNSDSPGNNLYRFPTEMYRSVGVGAEFDEPIKQGPSSTYNNNTYYYPPTNVQNVENKTISLTNNDESSFRAVIEIECALHLPKVDKLNGSIEPSTYVTFQTTQADSTNQLQSYTITNVYPHNCNPRWEWKCDIKLPTELLTHDERQLILKVWRLFNPDISTHIDMERDVVIGFAAIDISVLTTGFPSVSGWFHIMDFTGKCNGQIKVGITPLDNISAFVKSSTSTSTTQIPFCDSSRSNKSSLYSNNIFLNNIQSSNIQQAPVTATYNTTTSSYTDFDNHIGHPTIDITQSFEDVSMSFLSSSLKQKLAELDEITKRLQSRLDDVTNTAFEDYFDNDFDLNEIHNDNENIENRNTDVILPTAAQVSDMHDMHDMHDTHQNTSTNCMYTRVHTNNTNNTNNEYKQLPERMNDNLVTNVNVSNTRDTLNPISQSNSNLLNNHYQQDYHTQNDNALYNTETYPLRGTKVHINHLLDKLSLERPVEPYITVGSSMRRNVIDLLTTVQKDNAQNNNKSKHEIMKKLKPMQVENMSNSTHPNLVPTTTNTTTIDNQNLHASHSKISTVIREELVAEENNDTLKNDDELTNLLITSNVRHMDLDNIFNPLLYQHLVPDLQVSNSVSPETQAVEQLDTRYSKSFGIVINNGLDDMQDKIEPITLSPDKKINEKDKGTTEESSGNAEIFRLTPSGISENVDGNIHVTVIHNPTNNNLMASNSTESTTTISLGKSSTRQSEIELDENSYYNSSDISVSAASRQAPDGGNPIEDSSKILSQKQTTDTSDLSSSS
ncbi:PREDICTED: C2 domain-containing protein 3-like isoform X2 [Polistes dominula]|uniref:C2 domain-containing protein 3-like isoform X2 n=1 Tax=Polistes dominula TaxID=743375 RepID=A0ABM1IVM1_POLDO|nr:PREDICTED: C2 domain-containing protein 3-like isoform X2 [Polistes dominula]